MPNTETNPSPETKQPPLEDVLVEKIRTAYGMVIDRYGVGNIHTTAEILYDSLYHPSEVIDKYDIEADARFPQRLVVVAAEVVDDSITPPDREDFVATVRGIFTRDKQTHTEALYPGANEVIAMMLERGPTIIWTQGDMYGQRDGARGSYEQIKKIGGAGIGDLRRHEFYARQAGSGAQIPYSFSDVLTTIATEDKFSGESIARMVAYVQDHDVQEVVILEDKLANIQKLQKLLAEHDISSSGVWVKQGRHATHDEADTGQLVTAGSLEEATQEIKAIGVTSRVCFVVDLDGVLSNQDKRVKLTTEKLITSLQAKHWV